ncbi:MAG: substrate-binding domain-containing protein [Alphaproteobacteria bacterium]|nr:substrate-binding domain-containing protein [Alphaproteobacteria bacterium]
MSYIRNTMKRFIVKNSLTATFISSLMMPLNAGYAADNIIISGSTTVYPFSEVIAQRTQKQTGIAPVVQKTGSSAGLRAICNKEAHIANASRRIKLSELKKCQDNNINLVEFWIGRDGIVLTTHINNNAIKSLTRKQIYQATVKELYVKGTLVANPYKKWRDISPELPDIDITIYGPANGSGTRDAFHALSLKKGALSNLQMITLHKTDIEKFNELTQTLRDDGHYIEALENELPTTDHIIDNPNALAIFGYSYYISGRDRLRAIDIEGVSPNVNDIVSGYYKMSRPLYFYINFNDSEKSALLQSYVRSFIDKGAITGDGFLTKIGLIPLSNAEFSLEKAKLSKPVYLNEQILANY